MTVALEEKYDQVRQLIAMGKERGYLLYDEVNDILPPEVHSSEEIDDLLSTFERYGIDVYEDLSSAKAALAASDSAEPLEVKDEPSSSSEDGELDLTPGTLAKLEPCRCSPAKAKWPSRSASSAGSCSYSRPSRAPR